MRAGRTKGAWPYMLENVYIPHALMSFRVNIKEKIKDDQDQN